MLKSVRWKWMVRTCTVSYACNVRAVRLAKQLFVLSGELTDYVRAAENAALNDNVNQSFP